ncbi:MAG: hypothetical protein AAF544_13820, partial [Bacteroidota bacterium]
MKNSKLYDLLISLDPDQLKTFADYVQSPYLNKQEELGKLAAVFAKSKGNQVPDPEKCWKTLFPKEKFDNKKWSYLASGLLRLGEDFIAIEDLKQRKEEWALIKLRATARRGLEKSYRRQSKQFSTLMSEAPYHTQDHQRLKHDFLRLEINRTSRMGSRKQQPTLQSMLDTLEADYLARKWRIGCEMLNHQAILPGEFRFDWLGPEDDYTHLPAKERAELFRQAYNLLNQSDKGNKLPDFIANLQASAKRLDQNTRTALFQRAINSCVRQIRAGRRENVEILLDLYRIGLEEAYLLVDGQLAPLNYKNIIKLGLGLGQFEWVQIIIERYTQLLPDNNREDAYHYSLADLYYYQHEYDQALTHLRNTEFSDLTYALGARAMLLKIYYEQEETEALYALFSSFYIYLLRNKEINKVT